MVSASRYERELISWASQYGLVARTAASGTLNTIVGDLIVIPREGPPLIIEVKSTHKDVYYPSRDYRNISLLVDLSRHFNFVPILAVRFVGSGWVIIDLSKGIPLRITRDSARMLSVSRKTLFDWLNEFRQK